MGVSFPAEFWNLKVGSTWITVSISLTVVSIAPVTLAILHVISNSPGSTLVRLSHASTRSAPTHALDLGRARLPELPAAAVVLLLWIRALRPVNLPPYVAVSAQRPEIDAGCSP